MASVAPLWLLGSSSASAGPVASGSTIASAPTVPGPGTAYLGASADSAPTAPASDGASVDASALSTLDNGLAQPLSIVPIDVAWSEPAPSSSLDAIVAAGSIPLVMWNCGDTDANVSSGADDTLIEAMANQLAETKAPVLFDWFPDANASTATAQACLGTGGAAGYVAAFQHVEALFAAAGATNVGYVWSVDATASGSVPWESYYPGAGYVDWVAADGYYGLSTPAPPDTVSSLFGSWYSGASALSKPLMISGTGALPGAQESYLGQLAAQLPSDPLIQAVVYGDDSGQQGNSDPYQLDDAGLAAFQSLSQSAALRPARQATALTLTAPPAVTAAQAVALGVTLSPSDQGGSVTYEDNGTVIAGCNGLPVATGDACTVASLQSGGNELVASYSGDAELQPSASATVYLTAPPGDSSGSVAGGASGSGSGGSDGSGSSATSPNVQMSAGSEAPQASNGETGVTAPVPVPGPGQAYLGAFDDPGGTGVNATTPTGDEKEDPIEIAQLPTFNHNLARPLAIVPVPQGWTDPPPSATVLDRIVAMGGIPEIVWDCGTLDRYVAKPTGTANDEWPAWIASEAQKLASLDYPVLLDWFPGENNTATESTMDCLGNEGAAGYVAAYQEIHNIFVENGATNVSFVWSVDTTAGSQKWASYYPGSSFVDWIGADGFDTSSTTADSGTIASEFGAWYSAFSSAGKPLLITGTGALTPSATVPPTVQTSYLEALAAALPTQLPLVKGLIYSDAPLGGRHYEFATSSPGLAAFDALSQDSYFLPSGSPTSVTVSAATRSGSSPSLTQVVRATASVNGDVGGSLDFESDGTTIASCNAVPVLEASTCDTSALSEGTHSIQVSYSGYPGYAPSTSNSVTVTVGPVQGSSTSNEPPPPAIPSSGHAYLGAWLKPVPVHEVAPKDNPLQAEIQQLPAFNSNLAQPLQVVHVYQPWNKLTPSVQLRQVMADGAIPIIDWECNSSQANQVDTVQGVIDGNYDALITDFAKELAALKGPIFLRWYDEPNFPTSPTWGRCLGQDSASVGAAAYVAAFRHIHDLFVAAGATNVAFVWCIATSGTDPDWMDYYPGPQYVDWIAADGYERSLTPETTAFSLRFRTWYGDFSSFGKPMIITETGAFPTTQENYLDQVDQAFPSEFPLLKGLLYFDALGAYHTYALDQGGMTEFKKLSTESKFQPPRLTTSVQAGVMWPPSPWVGQRVELSASVGPTDGEGSVNFYLQGSPTPIAGCDQMQTGTQATCDTTLPAGDDEITAKYSGDAEFMPTESAPVSVAVSTSVGVRQAASSETITDPDPWAGVPDLAALGAMTFDPTHRAILGLLHLPNDGESYPKDFVNQFGTSDGNGDPTAGYGALAIIICLIILLGLALYIARSKWREQRLLRAQATDGAETPSLAANQEAKDSL